MWELTEARTTINFTTKLVLLTRRFIRDRVHMPLDFALREINVKKRSNNLQTRDTCRRLSLTQRSIAVQRKNTESVSISEVGATVHDGCIVVRSGSTRGYCPRSVNCAFNDTEPSSSFGLSAKVEPYNTDSQTSEKQALENSTCGRVWLTVHSPEIPLPGSKNLLDALELNWDFNGCPNIPRQVGLFRSRPSSWLAAVDIHPIVSVEGYMVTNVSLGEGNLPEDWLSGPGHKGPSCLWPWIGAGNNDIQAYNCLKIQPTWMEDNADKINKLRIGELAIAGTHNAGAWRFNTEMSNLERDSFVLCQDRSIWAQLVHGIRYFDFRIAYYDFYPNEEDRYWLNHNLIRVRPLVPLLQEIRTFLDNTKEIVFLDAHHFPVGFYEQNGSPIRSVHAGLLELVRRELGSHLADARQFGTGVGTRGPTVQALLDANKRLVFSYVDNAVVAENNWLWPILPHLWANTNNPIELFQYLDQAIASSPQPHARSPLHSAMAQTTPTVLDILFLRGSLRENAEAVNRNVTARLSTRWRYQANIVSTDFFLGNDVIDQSIALSVERASRL